MIDYLLAVLAILSIYKGTRFYLSWQKIPESKVDFSSVKPIFEKRGPIGVLLIHGFTSTPNDVRGLAEYLIKNNITVYAPVLPGHAKTPEELAITTYEDWLNATKDGIKLLKKHSKKVLIGGVSLGGNLAIVSALSEDIDGVVSMGTPLFFRKELTFRFIFPIIKHFKKFQQKRYRKRDFHLIKNKLHYHRIPLSKMRDVIILKNLTKKALPKLKCPILVMQSDNDYQINNKNARTLYDLAGSCDKKLVFIPDSYHVFINDKKRMMAFKEILKFINKI